MELCGDAEFNLLCFKCVVVDDAVVDVVVAPMLGHTLSDQEDIYHSL